jgi:hypothetical protein
MRAEFLDIKLRFDMDPDHPLVRQYDALKLTPEQKEDFLCQVVDASLKTLNEGARGIFLLREKPHVVGASRKTTRTASHSSSTKDGAGTVPVPEGTTKRRRKTNDS